MTIHNGRGGSRWQEKNGGILDGVEENGVGGNEGRKDSRLRQTYYPMYMYDYMNGVNPHCVQHRNEKLYPICVQ